MGVVILAACTAATIATAGSCGFLYAVAAGALKGALIGAVTGAVGGLVTGAVEYYEEHGTLGGSGKHILESVAVGFAEGIATGALEGGFGGALAYAKSPGSFCFTGGTFILTVYGYKLIEHIRIGDKVLSTDPETGETTEKTVLQTFERETTEFVDVTIDGESYTTTPEHPFYVEGKDFVNASKLEAGDKVVCYDTETDTTETKEVEEVHSYETDEPVSVYNFEVHENHTYHVGEDGVLVHNSCKKAGGSGSSGGKTFESKYEIPTNESGYTKSNLDLGKKVHKEYMSDVADDVNKIKEYVLPSGKRVDFIDFENKIVYELKPNNPNQIRKGTKQLAGYLEEIETVFGKGWSSVLDTY